MPEDSDLIRKFQSGDESSFDELVKKHLNNVFGFFLKSHVHRSYFMIQPNLNVTLY